MRDFEPGDEVEVKFRGKIQKVRTDSELYTCWVVKSMDSGYEHIIFTDAEGTDWNRAIPGDWPPVPGDVWKTEDETYFGRSDHKDVYLYPERIGSASRTPEDLLEAYPDIRLEFRKSR